MLPLPSTKVDDDGYMLGVYRDGSVKRLEIDGKPIRSNDFSHRVDRTAQSIADSMAGRGKTQEQIRAMAIQSLGGSASANAPTAKPGTGKLPDLRKTLGY